MKNRKCSPDYPAERLVSRNEHKHLCKKCGACWRHGNDNKGDEEAHTCECGNEVWSRHWARKDRKYLNELIEELEAA